MTEDKYIETPALPSRGQWKMIARRVMYITMVSLSVLLLPAGFYFLFLFQKSNFPQVRGDWTLIAITVIALACGIAALFTLIWNCVGPHRHRPSGFVRRFLPIVLLPLVFLAQVELFGIWLGNADAVFIWMNHPFSGAKAVTTATYGPGKPGNARVQVSPDGTKLLWTQYSEYEQEVEVRLSVLDTSCKTLRTIAEPNANYINYPLPAWSPDGSKIAGLYSKYEKSGDLYKLFLWVLDIHSGQMKSEEIGEYPRIGPFYLRLPTWSPDSQSIALPKFVLSDIQTMETGGICATPSRTGILIWRADTLKLPRSIPVQLDNSDINGKGFEFLDNDNLLYSPEYSDELWTLNVITGEKRIVPLSRSTLGQVLVVRDGKWLLAGLLEPPGPLPPGVTSNSPGEGPPQPFLVEIATGKLEPLHGLPGSGDDFGFEPLWDTGAVDRKGDVAVVHVSHNRNLWPHPSISQLYYWKEGSDRFVEYKPMLVQKFRPSVDASGRKMVYGWGNKWNIVNLPKEMTN